MADRRFVGRAALAIAGLALGVAALLRGGTPEDPAELFRERCSACHALPDLGRYRREDMAAIVRTMREKNGADAVISEAEAARIIAYLEERAEQ